MGNTDKDAIEECAINDTPIHECPNLVHFFSLSFTTGEPIVITNGPKGHRCIVPDLKGTFKGGSDYPDFHGILHGPSSDFVLIHSDGSGVSLDVNFIFTTHDGITFLGKIVGRSVRDANDPKKASIRGALTFEAGHEKLKFLNNLIAVSKGRKDGNKVEIDYYLMS